MADPVDPIDALIREIAVKHGIAVSRDDPILVLQTINQRLLEDSARAQQSQLDQFQAELDALSLRWSNDARARAERLLTASLVAGKEALAQALSDSASASAAVLRAETDSILTRLAAPVATLRRTALLGVVASWITLLAAALVLWSVRA